jgi:zinc/manganese transport system substrate-binding protein
MFFRTLERKTTMKRVMLLCLTLLAPAAQAAFKVFACEPEWAALAQELGGDRITAFSATTAKQDPHHIEARPSLIARVRNADLVACTGAELEAGWLPVLLRSAGNARVQPGQPGYFEAAAVVTLLNIPAQVDRSMGDIHAAGNPHLHLDPRRIAAIAQRLAERLTALDPANAAHYRARHADFERRWQAAIREWTNRAAPLKGMRVVSHHRNTVYLRDWLDLTDAGALEPKPGIPPTAAHLAALKEALARDPARVVVRMPFEDDRPSAWLARETGTRAVVLPYTVGGTPAAKDLFALFDDTLARLLEGAR